MNLAKKLTRFSPRSGAEVLLLSILDHHVDLDNCRLLLLDLLVGLDEGTIIQSPDDIHDEFNP